MLLWEGRLYMLNICFVCNLCVNLIKIIDFEHKQIIFRSYLSKDIEF